MIMIMKILIMKIVKETIDFPTFNRNLSGRAIVQERHIDERSNLYKKLEGVKTFMWKE